MQLLAKHARPETVKTATLVLSIAEGGKLGSLAASVDQASAGALSRLLKRGDLAGKPGQTLLLLELIG